MIHTINTIVSLTPKRTIHEIKTIFTPYELFPYCNVFKFRYGNVYMIRHNNTKFYVRMIRN